MSSTSLKHQARLREWSVAVQDCRGSGLPVSRWRRENGITVKVSRTFFFADG